MIMKELEDEYITVDSLAELFQLTPKILAKTLKGLKVPMIPAARIKGQKQSFFVSKSLALEALEEKSKVVSAPKPKGRWLWNRSNRAISMLKKTRTTFTEFLDNLEVAQRWKAGCIIPFLKLGDFIERNVNFDNHTEKNRVVCRQHLKSHFCLIGQRLMDWDLLGPPENNLLLAQAIEVNQNIDVTTEDVQSVLEISHNVCSEASRSKSFSPIRSKKG